MGWQNHFVRYDLSRELSLSSCILLLPGSGPNELLAVHIYEVTRLIAWLMRRASTRLPSSSKNILLQWHRYVIVHHFWMAAREGHEGRNAWQRYWNYLITWNKTMDNNNPFSIIGISLCHKPSLLCLICLPLFFSYISLLSLAFLCSIGLVLMIRPTVSGSPTLVFFYLSLSHMSRTR